MFVEQITSKALFIVVATLLTLAGGLLLRSGSREFEPSLDPPMLDKRDKAFIGAIFLFVAFTILITWILNPRV